MKCLSLPIILAMTGMVSSSCSLAPTITQNSVDYNTTVEDVTNNVLVTNALRARDQAPLFFSDLSQIRGSLSASSNTQLSFPFGPTNRPSTGTGVRDSAQETLSIITNPTFDIAPTNTKQFYSGILEPISGNVVSYLVQRGIRSDWIVNLIVSQIEKVTVRKGREPIVETINFSDPGDTSKPTPRFVSLVTGWYNHNLPPRARVVVHSETADYGPAVLADARALVEAKSAGLDARGASGPTGHVQFSSKVTTIKLCVPDLEHGGYDTVQFIVGSIVRKVEAEEVPKSNAVCNGSPNGKAAPGSEQFTYYTMRTRSVEGLFYYLGWVISLEQEPPIPFHVSDHPTADVRFGVEYRGRRFYVANARSGDNTLTILSILNDLLNVNRAADEVPTTKAVQAVGASL